MRWLTQLLVLGIVGSLVVHSEGQEKKKQPQKKRVAFTDAKEAGPDFALQGEYEGSSVAGRWGAQVIAHGDSNFTVHFLQGGLPGAGWDGKTRITAKTISADGRLSFKAKVDWSGHFADGRILVHRPDAGEVEWVPAPRPILGRWFHGRLGTRYVSRPTDDLTLYHVKRRGPTLGARPPRGAVVLLDGSSADPGERGKLVEGNLLSPLAPGNIVSKKAFTDFYLHMEFRTPFMPFSGGQGRGNSGVYLQDRYECQVLDSFGLTGENNECGGFYTQHKPKVNMCLPPLSWQTYDIDFKAARFKDAKKVANAVVTVRHNGVVIHDSVELPGPSPGGKKEEDTPGPIQLQNHGDPVVYRNIWVVERK